MKPRTRARPRVLPAALATAVVLVVSACGARSGVLDGDSASGGTSDGGGAPAVGADGGAGGGKDGSVADGGCGGDGCSSQPPGADASTSPPSPDGVCPMSPPGPGVPCWPDGMSCPYDTAGGCGVTAVCSGGTWEWFPPDPFNPPCNTELASGCEEGAPCQLQICAGAPDDAGCITTACTCGPAGTYVCYHPVQVLDAGTGCESLGPCPYPSPPANGEACTDVGWLCPYYEDGCETNCLCAPGGWSCAREEGC